MLQGYGSPDGESTCSLNPRGDANSKASIEKVSKGTEEREPRELPTDVCEHVQELHADTVFLTTRSGSHKGADGQAKEKAQWSRAQHTWKVMDI